MPRGRPKKLTAEQVMAELARHEKECGFRYTRLEEKLEDNKVSLKSLDVRLWGLSVLIIGAAVAENFLP